MHNNNATIPYTMTPIAPAFVQKIRDTGRDDQDQAVEHLVASGGEPCRDVLRRAAPGEALILASYCPFALAGPYRELGPVFVLADPQPQAVLPTTLAALWECGYLKDPFVLRAYSEAERIVEGVVVSRAQAEDSLQAMLHRQAVRFVLARFAGYGCYACRIERT